MCVDAEKNRRTGRLVHMERLVELMEQAHISDYTIRKLNRGDNVTTDVLVRICRALDCTLDDIMEILPEDKE